jgi:poly(A) polymerase Pap1
VRNPRQIDSQFSKRSASLFFTHISRVESSVTVSELFLLFYHKIGEEASLVKESSNFTPSETDESLGIKILKYGSYPLQTYLPDSDIDITVHLFCRIKKELD